MHLGDNNKGAFENVIDGRTTFGGYRKGEGPECPKCGSKNTRAIWRDVVWDETGCACDDCGKTFIK